MGNSLTQNEERESLEAFAQKFWSFSENVKRFQNSLLSRGNVAIMSRCVTSEERSNERRLEVGLPTHDEPIEMPVVKHIPLKLGKPRRVSLT